MLFIYFVTNISNGFAASILDDLYSIKWNFVYSNRTVFDQNSSRLKSVFVPSGVC